MPEACRGALPGREPINLKPAIGADAIAHFNEKLESVSGRVTRVARIDQVADVVARILQRFDLGDSLVVAPDPTLEGIPWSNRLSVERRAAAGGDRLSVTGAYAAVAETGSLVLLSSPKSPTTLNFLPEDHVIVVRESQMWWSRARTTGGCGTS